MSSLHAATLSVLSQLLLCNGALFVSLWHFQGSLRELQSQVQDDASNCNIMFRRGHVLEDALRAAGRSSFRPYGRPQVWKTATQTSFVSPNATVLLLCMERKFIGEEGRDTGGLTRELWRLLCPSMSQSLFHGPVGKRTIIHSVQRLQV